MRFALVCIAVALAAPASVSSWLLSTIDLAFASSAWCAACGLPLKMSGVQPMAKRLLAQRRYCLAASCGPYWGERTMAWNMPTPYSTGYSTSRF